MQGAANSMYRLIATVFVAIALAGCAPSAQKVFDEYAETSTRIETIHLFNDALVQENVRGTHDRVGTNEARERLELIGREVRKTLPGESRRTETVSESVVSRTIGLRTTSIHSRMHFVPALAEIRRDLGISV